MSGELDELLDRLGRVETVVGGHSRDSAGRVVPTILESLTSAVASMTAEVDAIVSEPGNEDIADVLAKVDEVVRRGLLTPGAAVPVAKTTPGASPALARLDVEAKVALMEAAAPFIDSLSAQLAELDTLSEVLDSAAIADVPRHGPALAPLREASLTLAADVQAQDASIHAALADYADAMDLLSLKFVQWDAILSRAEAAAS